MIEIESAQLELNGLETIFAVILSHPPIKGHCSFLREQSHIGAENIMGNVSASSEEEAQTKTVTCKGCGTQMSVILVKKPPKKTFVLQSWV